MERIPPVDPVLEKGYDVRMLRDDFAQIVDAWSSRSALLRDDADGHLDCPYDAAPNSNLDIFLSGETDAPLFVFIHGGYWQRGDKSVYSFVAEPFLETGVDVAILGYQLCPGSTMTSLASQIRAAIVWLWRNAKQVDICADRINVSGHSAGGHLTAMLLASQWNSYGNDVPHDLIKSGIPISGLYQLEPLLQTTISDALHMDEEEARLNSPHFLKPQTKAPILVTLGGAETPQFHWQTDEFVDKWVEYDAPIEKYAEPGVDHFDVINRLSQTDSAIFERVRGWLR